MTDQDLQTEKRRYPKIFGALIVLALVTVGISYLKPPMALAIVIALVVAAVMAALQAGFFMHLMQEKKIIHVILAMAFLFIAGLLLLPLWQDYSIPEGTLIPKGGKPTPIHGHHATEMPIQAGEHHSEEH